MIKISVPARICFYGDHQDYLGLPVIAGAIDRYIHISGSPNEDACFSIALNDIGKHIRIDLDDPLQEIPNGDYFRSAMSVLKQYGLKLNKGYNLEVQGDIPVNAGLSSSSAVTVAWIRFLLASQKADFSWDNKQIGRWAYEAEVIYFKQPGGLMDQYSIAQGGLLYIETKEGGTEPLNANLGKMVVAESGLPKQTLDVLKNGRVYGQNAILAVKEKHPEFNMDNATVKDYETYKHLVPEQYQDHWYAAVHNYNITLTAKAELLKSEPDSKILGSLMDKHQNILQNQIQNTPKPMAEMMEAAREAGALGTKIIGSGGGGCMVALVSEETSQSVIEAFLEAGAKSAYEVNITYNE
ncbi:mevalonate kinase family protein [Flagellimonas flava]|uniref:Galactokinase n=1 Tax=Flagellimonas flava TaxID=570519 RepID=A0A1M5PD37_9FLAO|nr:galactokinase family protein [Allomuricauda flava]SHG99627.1 galactokinase [Allomuricauda flava]